MRNFSHQICNKQNEKIENFNTLFPHKFSPLKMKKKEKGKTRQNT